jgi:hypothetical protein
VSAKRTQEDAEEEEVEGGAEEALHFLSSPGSFGFNSVESSDVALSSSFSPQSSLSSVAGGFCGPYSAKLLLNSRRKISLAC